MHNGRGVPLTNGYVYVRVPISMNSFRVSPIVILSRSEESLSNSPNNDRQRSFTAFPFEGLTVRPRAHGRVGGPSGPVDGRMTGQKCLSVFGHTEPIVAITINELNHYLTFYVE